MHHADDTHRHTHAHDTSTHADAGMVLLAQADTSTPPTLEAPPAPTGAGNTPGVPTQPVEGQPLTGPGAPTPTSPGNSTFLILMVLMVAGLFLMTTLAGRKDKKRKAEMLGSLKKGARVQMAGGMLGNVVEVRDDEVVVKIDENANTRARFVKSAVVAVVDSEQ